MTLTVLNAPNEFGEIIVALGDTVEVEFSIVDPLNETSPQDLILLRRVGDNSVANKQQRGKELTGSRSIGTQKVNGSDILGETPG